jgi:hypothetical protein
MSYVTTEYKKTDFIWVSEWLLLTPSEQLFRWELITFQWDNDDVHFVPDQHA